MENNLSYTADLVFCKVCGTQRLGGHGVGHNGDVIIRGQVEAAILQTIADHGLPTGTARSEAKSRRIAIRLVANAIAHVICDDLMHGRDVWPNTLAKYTMVHDLLGGCDI